MTNHSKRPIVGDMLHFYPEDKDKVLDRMEAPYAALVSHEGKKGVVNLTVFGPAGTVQRQDIPLRDEDDDISNHESYASLRPEPKPHVVMTAPRQLGPKDDAPKTSDIGEDLPNPLKHKSNGHHGHAHK